MKLELTKEGKTNKLIIDYGFKIIVIRVSDKVVNDLEIIIENLIKENK